MRKNLHTGNQPKGSAQNLSDTLDRESEKVAPGQRQRAEDSDWEPGEADQPPLEGPGAPGGTSGTGGTNHDQDR